MDFVFSVKLGDEKTHPDRWTAIKKGVGGHSSQQVYVGCKSEQVDKLGLKSNVWKQAIIGISGNQDRGGKIIGLISFNELIEL